VSSNSSNSRRKPSLKFWLLTLTWNRALRLAMLKKNFRKKKTNINNSSSKPQLYSNHKLHQVADYKPGDCLKKGPQILIPFSIQKRCEKSEAPHINKESSRSEEHTTSVFTVKSHLNTTQYTVSMQMPQYKLAALLRLKCYINNIIYQQPLLLVALLPNDPPPPAYVRSPLLLHQ